MREEREVVLINYDGKEDGVSEDFDCCCFAREFGRDRKEKKEKKGGSGEKDLFTYCFFYHVLCFRILILTQLHVLLHQHYFHFASLRYIPSCYFPFLSFLISHHNHPNTHTNTSHHTTQSRTPYWDPALSGGGGL